MKFNHWQKIHPENSKIVILAEQISGSISLKIKVYYQREKRPPHNNKMVISSRR